MRCLLALVVVLMAAPVCAQVADPPSTPAEKVYQWTFVAASAVHVADISTTSSCIGRRTCVEANPALRWADKSPAGLGLAKGALAGGLHLAIHRLLWKRGHKWQAITANLVVIGITSAVTARNARF